MRRRVRLRRIAATASLVLAAAALALTAAALSPDAAPRAPAVAGNDLPASVAPAFSPGTPRRLGSTRHLSYWAPLRRAVAARSAASASAPVVAQLERTTPEGTTNAVAILGRRKDAAGRLWLRVSLPVLPNGSRGWVRRAALGGYGTVATLLAVDLGRLTATLYRNGKPVLRAPVGVGMAGWETPPGRFYVRNRLTRYASPAYGPVAFGTSARSPVATDWPAGGFIGIHGTDRPDLVPGRISHGCIRMRNEDILALARLMPVGTPLRVS